jgi:hypothetical protein
MSIYKGCLLPVGADSYVSFKNRIYKALNALPEGDSLLFGHSGNIRMIIELFDAGEPYICNCGFIIFEFDDITKGGEVHCVFEGFTH